MSFVIENGAYKSTDPCPGCGSARIKCWPGAWPKCEECGAKLVCFGRVPEAECVSGNGRIDGHMKYVRNVDGMMVCDFCGKPWSATPDPRQQPLQAPADRSASPDTTRCSRRARTPS